MNWKTHMGIVGCLLLACCTHQLKAQKNIPFYTNSVDTPRMDTFRLDSQEMKEFQQMQSAVANPGWYVISKVASIFNVGVYYSYLTPVGSFKNQVSASSCVSVDIGLDLTRMVGRNDADFHLLTGMNADFTNFGTAKNKYNYAVGDTSYHVVLKNSMEAYSFYLELEYRKSFFCPFASLAYSIVYLNPYREQEKKISNSTTNLSETSGDYLSDEKSRGINAAIGLKCKYRFNAHKELMLVAKMSYVKSSAIKMVDLESVNFSPTGVVTYTTSQVQPSWILFSLGVKYNF